MGASLHTLAETDQSVCELVEEDENEEGDEVGHRELRSGMERKVGPNASGVWQGDPDGPQEKVKRARAPG